VGNDIIFKQNGFDDFIPKPIDIRYLNVVLNKYVRDMYPEEAAKYKLTARDEQKSRHEKNQKLLKLFLSDAKEAVITLRKTIANGDMKLFTVTAHAMKSALTNIGKDDISKAAYALEAAGRTGDMEFIAANHEAFIESLEALIISLGGVELTGPDAEAKEDMAYLAEQLLVIRTACEDYDDSAAYAALNRLKEKPWKKETVAALEEIHDMLFLDSNFEGVEARVQKLKEANRL